MGKTTISPNGHDMLELIIKSAKNIITSIMIP